MTHSTRRRRRRARRLRRRVSRRRPRAAASRSSIPKPNPGGVCVYRGCIPSKALLHVAKVIDEARHAKAWGVEFGEPKIDLDKLRAFKNNVVKRLTSGTGQLVKQRKVQLHPGPRRRSSTRTRCASKRTDGGEETLDVRARDPRDRLDARRCRRR